MGGINDINTSNNKGSYMPFLINGPENKETLIKCLAKAARETTKPERDREFYGLTCYFDMEAIKRLARRIKNSVGNAQGNLIGFHIAVDAGEWIKSRIAIEDIIDKLKTGLTPVQLSLRYEKEGKDIPSTYIKFVKDCEENDMLEFLQEESDLDAKTRVSSVATTSRQYAKMRGQ